MKNKMKSKLLILSFLVLWSSPLVQSYCGEYNSCANCLNHECAWTIGICMDTCLIPDVSCYEILDNTTANEICETEAKVTLDNLACSSAISSCEECTGTSLPSDPTKNCMWLEDGKSCEGEALGFLPQGILESSECPPDILPCNNNYGCSECLHNGCVWNAGQCFEECMVADVECYRLQNPSQTIDEVCLSFTDTIVDDDACSSDDIVSCQECFETRLPSDASKTCMWSEGGGCVRGMVSGFFNVLIDISQCPADPISTCDSHENCSDCLQNECVWVLGMCTEECNIADVTCYEWSQSINQTSDDICELASDEILDYEACSSIDLSTCEKCTETKWPSDPSKTCMWIEDFKSCQKEAGMIAPGITNSSDCSLTTPTCSIHFDCKSCLESECIWTAGVCLEDCLIADVPCYSTSVGNQTADELCELEANALLDHAVCTSATITTCEECTETNWLSDPSKGCTWMEDGKSCVREAVGVLPPGILNIGDCPVNTPTCIENNDCNSCLDNGCVWSTGVCMEECFISDVPCYELSVANETSDFVCELESNATIDKEACSSLNIESCETCTETALPSDPSKNCMWHDFLGECASEAISFLPPGVTNISECNALCSSHRTCTNCIDNGCSWSGKTCAEDCNTGTECYTSENFGDQTPDVICNGGSSTGILTTLLSSLASLSQALEDQFEEDNLSLPEGTED